MPDIVHTGPAVNDVPLPRPGDPLMVIWYVPKEQDQVVVWRRDGQTFEAPILLLQRDAEHPYREEVWLTAWSQARPSTRPARQLDDVAGGHELSAERQATLPRPGCPIMLWGDDVLIWKAMDGKVYTTPGGESPHYWDRPGAEDGWVVTFATFDEIHPYDFDWEDHGPLLDQPL